MATFLSGFFSRGSTETETDTSLEAAINASSAFSSAAFNVPVDSEDDDESASFTTASSSRTQLEDEEDFDDDSSDFEGDLWEQIDTTTLVLILIPMIARIIGRKCTLLAV